ncbi:MAG: TonB-dependent receptor, partial [Bacteroidota bacterium]
PLKKILLLSLFTLFTASILMGQKTVTGTITDEGANPLVGVNIVIKGTTNGTTTDFNGQYDLLVNENDILVFSYLGYKDQEITVGTQTTIDVQLQGDTEFIDEVVVIGYGTTAKKDLVSSVSQVKGEVLQNQPVPRLDQALQGRAAGVEVVSNNGAPGAAATIRIRGTNSINGNINPLFVIDGFIAGTDFNLNNLNVNDIESIEVLKDATSLAIYGTRGAAGVVLVTTKNGSKIKSQKPQIKINQYYTTQQVTNEIEVLGGVGYANYLNEAGQFVPGPEGFGFTDTSLPLVFDDPAAAPNTDWLGLVTQNGTILNTDLSISGNNDKINYYISFNRFDQEGLLKESGLERYTFRTNLDLNLSSKLRTGIRLNIASGRTENNKINYSQIIGSVLPTREVFDTDGEFTATNPVSASLQRNPVADYQLRVDHNFRTNIVSNAYLEYEPIPNLRIKSSIGLELNSFKGNLYQPGALPERRANNAGGFARVNTSRFNSILNENIVTYNFDLGKHGFTVLGGFSIQQNTTESLNASAEGFPNDVVQFNNLSFGSDPESFVVGSGFSRRSFVSQFGRINYNYDDRYLITFAARRDGSSVFEDGNKYGFFPSIGAAWNIHNEGFMDNTGMLSRLKLRASFGEVGEQGVGIYNSIARFNNVNAYFNETLVNGVLLGALPSKDLSWETTRQLDIGLEIGLLEDRITVELDYYNKTTEDLLLNRELPNTAGGNQLQNIGKVENNGIEIAINSFNISKQDFSWETQLTLSANRNRVIDLGGDEFINLRQPTNQGGPGTRLIVGETMPVFIGALYLGTYKTAEEIIADGREGISFLGSPRYQDLDGNGVINDLDYVIIGSPQPDFYGGLRNVFRYKNLTLDIYLQGSYGNEIYNGVNQTHFFGRGDQNLFPVVLDRWQQGTTENSDIPRAGTSSSLFNPNSTVGIEDGSFLRLRTLTLSYDVPLKNQKFLRNIQLYATGTNLLLWTDFSMGDPEVSNYGRSIEQGVATGQYPYARSFTFGINVDF